MGRVRSGFPAPRPARSPTGDPIGYVASDRGLPESSHGRQTVDAPALHPIPSVSRWATSSPPSGRDAAPPSSQGTDSGQSPHNPRREKPPCQIGTTPDHAPKSMRHTSPHPFLRIAFAWTEAFGFNPLSLLAGLRNLPGYLIDCVRFRSALRMVVSTVLLAILLACRARSRHPHGSPY